MALVTIALISPCSVSGSRYVRKWVVDCMGLMDLLYVSVSAVESPVTTGITRTPALCWVTTSFVLRMASVMIAEAHGLD